MEEDIYKFATLEDAIVYFERLGFLPVQVKIGGAFLVPAHQGKMMIQFSLLMTEVLWCSSIGRAGHC